MPDNKEADWFYDKPPEYIYVNYQDPRMRWTTRFYRVVYFSLKTFHSSVWFYFIPFTSLYLSYAIPYHFGNGEDYIGKTPVAE